MTRGAAVAHSGLDMAAAYELAFEALPDGVLIIDRSGAILVVNRELERLFGYTREELVGQPVELLVPEALRAAHVDHRRRFLESPGRRAMTDRSVAGRRKDGSEFPVHIGLNVSEPEGGRFVIATVADVTEQRRLEDAQHAQLEERLALERLVAELSSEFINLPADRIDTAIRDGLRKAAELLRLDRGTFIRLGRDGAMLAPIGWTAPNVRTVDATAPLRDMFPWTIDRLLSGHVVSFTSRDDVPSEVDRASFEGLGTQSAVSVPLSVDGHVTALIGFSAVTTPRTWAPELVHRLTLIASVFAQVVARQHHDEALQAAIDEAQRLKQQLQVENVYLRHEARERNGPIEIVGRSPTLRQVLAQAEQVASTDSTVLLLGETGTGKELFANYIHSLSARRARPMVRVNCAAIPATLIESELFGREKGAFTGALARQVGRFEVADHSTIFLDEIGDLPLEVQVKLLRVLEERKFERLGSPRPISVDTRIIAATHRNLEQRIAEGGFREDLYYRLNVFPIHVPPLRERGEDIPLLVYRLVEEFSRAFGKRIDVIDKDSVAALQHYAWPGNIRELRNVVERAMIVTTSRKLVIPVPESSASVSAHSPRLADVEREHILAVLESSGWRIRGAGGAATRLGMKPTTLETRMAKLGLRRPTTSS